MTVAKVLETAVEPKKVAEGIKIKNVVVHPVVLLAVVDHYNRMGKAPMGQKRVVGALLGSLRGNVLDISNCFAVPFEEDSNDPSVWFLDHDYLENMFSMFKKVNAKEKVVGWYHSGPKLAPNDIKINELLRKYNPNSVLVVVDVKKKESDGLPTEAYIAVEEIHDDGTPTTKTFNHLKSEIGAEEAEEVGVEHLLRDIKDTTVNTLSQRISSQLDGLEGLIRQLSEIREYLDLVSAKKIPMNYAIIYQLQDIFNLLPDLRLHDRVRSLHVNSNDQMLVIYVAAIIRAILALHDLINNKFSNRENEKCEDVSSTQSSSATTSSNSTNTASTIKQDNDSSDGKPASGSSKSPDTETKSKSPKSSDKSDKESSASKSSGEAEGKREDGAASSSEKDSGGSSSRSPSNGPSKRKKR